jgi:hypothetical protein
MMKHVNLHLAGTTSSAKWPVVLKDKCRVVGMRVVSGVNQAEEGGAYVTAGKDGADHTILTADLDPATALVPVAAGYTDSVTDDEKTTVFGPETPLVIDVKLASAGKVGIVLELDPFLINDTI